MMRKLMCVVLVLAALMSAGMPAALAARHGRSKRCEPVCEVMDENKDAACINCEADCSRDSFMDEDQDGICDNRPIGCSSDCYADMDQDGICDNWNRHCETRSNRKNDNGDGNCEHPSVNPVGRGHHRGHGRNLGCR